MCRLTLRLKSETKMTSKEVDGNKCLMNCSHHNSKTDWEGLVESWVWGENQTMQVVYLLYTHAVVHRI